MADSLLQRDFSAILSSASRRS